MLSQVRRSRQEGLAAPQCLKHSAGCSPVFSTYDFAPFPPAFVYAMQVEMHYNQHGQSRGSALVIMQVTLDSESTRSEFMTH